MTLKWPDDMARTCAHGEIKPNNDKGIEDGKRQLRWLVGAPDRLVEACGCGFRNFLVLYKQVGTTPNFEIQLKIWPKAPKSKPQPEEGRVKKYQCPPPKGEPKTVHLGVLHVPEAVQLIPRYTCPIELGRLMEVAIRRDYYNHVQPKPFTLDAWLRKSPSSRASDILHEELADFLAELRYAS